MTNLRDGCSKRFRCYSRHTVLETGFACFRSKFRATLFPFSIVLSFLCLPPKLLLKRNWFKLPIPCQHHRSRRRRVASHTAQFTVFLHSTVVKIFAGVPPNNNFQLVQTFIPCKRKFRNTTSTLFCRHTVHKNCETAKFHTHQFTIRGHSTQ